MWLRHYHLAWPVLALSFTACERTQPLAPVLEASTAAPGPTVNAPSNLGAAAVDTARINLSWQDNAGNESGFEVHRATPWPSSVFTLRAKLPTNTIAFSDTGLILGHRMRRHCGATPTAAATCTQRRLRGPGARYHGPGPVGRQLDERGRLSRGAIGRSGNVGHGGDHRSVERHLGVLR